MWRPNILSDYFLRIRRTRSASWLARIKEIESPNQNLGQGLKQNPYPNISCTNMVLSRLKIDYLYTVNFPRDKWKCLFTGITSCHSTAHKIYKMSWPSANEQKLQSYFLHKYLEKKYVQSALPHIFWGSPNIFTWKKLIKQFTTINVASGTWQECYLYPHHLWVPEKLWVVFYFKYQHKTK